MNYLEVKKTLLHLSFFRDHSLILHPGWCTKFNIAMPFEVEFCEATDITSSIHMNGEFPEKVDDGWRTIG